VKQALAGVVLAVAAGACAAPSDPPAASPGLFPTTYTGAMVVHAPLVKSAEVGPGKSALTFHVAVPKGQAYTVVVLCERGRIDVSLPGGSEHAACGGSALPFIDGGCDGGKRTLTVHVSEAQPKSWGVALYTARDVATAPCR
jgi:hypothetical protein